MWRIIGLSVFVILAYQNCAPGFKAQTVSAANMASMGLLAGQGCESILVETYKKDIYSFFGGPTGKCVMCHVNGPGVGNFAHSDQSVAYSAFSNAGASRVIGQIVTNHQSVTGEQNRSEHDRMMGAWNTAQQKYAQCKNSSTTTASELPLVTTDKTLPANFLTVPANNQQNGAFTQLTWNLETEVQGSRVGTVKANFRIEVRPYIRNIQGVFSVAGYEFRNPSVQVTQAGVAYDIGYLYLTFNGIGNEAFTTYVTYAKTFNTQEYVSLVTSDVRGPLILDAPNAMDKIGFGFRMFKANSGTPINSEGGTGTPGGGGGGGLARVTYAQLTANGGVFQARCYSCHSGNNIRGGLNLANFTMAQASAADILARMTNANNPMPTTGLLGNAEVDMVRGWVQNGAPQN